MWTLSRTTRGFETEHWRLLDEDGADVTVGQVLAGWGTNAAFTAFWSACLRGVSFEAYCWECPALSLADLARPFECVIVRSPLLANSRADAGPFAAVFDASRAAVSFPNLGGDAWLVAPCPGEPGSDFTHLARFMATAGEARIAALWREVAAAVSERLGERPIWLSTAGLGVAWLHVRLDSRPKYYRYAVYKAR